MQESRSATEGDYTIVIGSAIILLVCGLLAKMLF